METPRVAVAYSGGRDSTALLHATVAVAKASGVEVVALHVHHGLSANADRWLAHCAARCRRWRALGAPLGFVHRRLTTRPAAGDSIEAWARRERHAALAAMARDAGATLLLLAHHRQDQAETFLLQALRGAGAAGLAAMPKEALRGGVVWARPWLDVPRRDIDAYLRAHRLRHVDDDSNADPRYARNRLRREVWTALDGAFGPVDGTLADAARRVGDALRCADDLAAIDLAALAGDDGLDVAGWSALDPARRRNALRAWLARETAGAVPATLVERVAAEGPGTAPAEWPCGAHLLRRYRGRLRVDRAAPPGGQLDAWPVDAGGISPDRFAALRPVERHGGERFQRAPRTVPRSLKKAFQTAGVPPWERAAPLFYDGATLVYVPGLGIDARAWAPAGTPQVMVAWRPLESAAAAA